MASTARAASRCSTVASADRPTGGTGGTFGTGGTGGVEPGRATYADDGADAGCESSGCSAAAKPDEPAASTSSLLPNSLGMTSATCASLSSVLILWATCLYGPRANEVTYFFRCERGIRVSSWPS
jgi:hypothetical protein